MTCNEALYERIRENLRAFKVRSQEGEGLRRAAVAITVVDLGDELGVYGIPIHAFPRDDAALVLTRRSLKLKHHAGQWALPGGRVDPGEDPEDTALRELAEEVGLELPRQSVIGRLDDFATRSRFVITKREDHSPVRSFPYALRHACAGRHPKASGAYGSPPARG